MSNSTGHSKDKQTSGLSPGVTGENFVEKRADKFVSTFILDQADNLSIILTTPQIKPTYTETICRTARQDPHIIDSKFFSGNQVNISKQRQLLQINTLSVDIKVPVNSIKSNFIRQKFLALFSPDQRLPLEAILDFACLFPPSWDTPSKRSFKVNIGIETQYILDAIHSLLQTINTQNNVSIHKKAILNEFLSTSISAGINELLSLSHKRNVFIDNNLDIKTIEGICMENIPFNVIFQNILFNALQHSDPGSTITIDQKIISNDQIKIQIIAPTEKDSLSKMPLTSSSKPFNKVNMSTYLLEGSGIGLIIAKKLVELVKGTVSVEFKAGEGNTFELALPFKDITTKGTATNSTTLPLPQHNSHLLYKNSSSPGLYNVLYIEDDKTHIQLVASIFKKLPNIVFSSATTPETGINLAIQTIPDLILLDIRLPEMSGYEVFSLLRDTSETRSIPIIALSAAAMPHEVTKALELGFTHYLTKPFHINELIAIVSQELAKNTKLDALIKH